jgi:hypothetical protein
MELLTNPYYRAHKAYAFFAGLLLAWAFVGIEIQNPPIESVNFTLNSPEAVPYVLAVLIVYFGFRLTIEWFQSPSAARKKLSARIDLFIAHFLGVASILLFVVQLLFEFQIATASSALYAVPLFFGLLSGLGIFELVRYQREGQTDRLRLAVYVLLTIVPILMALLFVVVTELKLLIGSFIFGGIMGGGIWWFLRKSTRI